MSPTRVTDAACRAALRKFRAAERTARVGLSSVHTSPSYWAECSPDGAYLASRSRGTRQSSPPKFRRGRVTEFSRRSRSRLLQLCATIDRDESAKALFVTLTYGPEWPDPSMSKRHLDRLSKRLADSFPGSSVIWKLEFQRRGAPHYHLLVYGIPYLAHQWIARAWYEIVGSGNEDHLRAGTEVRRCVSYRAAFSYAAKYVAKLGEGPVDDYWGRYWGVFQRRSLPRTVLQWGLDKRGSVRLARVIRGLVRSRGRAGSRARGSPSWVVCRGDRAAALLAWLSP